METEAPAAPSTPRTVQARRNKIGGAVILLIVALGVGWCSWRGSQGGVPQTLQNRDAGEGYSHPLSEYRNVWADATARCTETSDELQTLIENVLPTLRVTRRADRDRLALLDNISVGVDPAWGKVDCAPYISGDKGLYFKP